MKDFHGFISEAKSEKVIVLPHGMGTVKVVKTTDSKGEPMWSFDYNGVRGTIVRGWSRMGGGGYAVREVTDTDGFSSPPIHGTYRTVSDAAVRGTEYMRWAKAKAGKP